MNEQCEGNKQVNSSCVPILRSVSSGVYFSHKKHTRIDSVKHYSKTRVKSISHDAFAGYPGTFIWEGESNNSKLPENSAGSSMHFPRSVRPRNEAISSLSVSPSFAVSSAACLKKDETFAGPV
eukprot:755463-Hanusia_phi.AAC.5